MITKPTPMPVPTVTYAHEVSSCVVSPVDTALCDLVLNDELQHWEPTVNTWFAYTTACLPWPETLCPWRYIYSAKAGAFTSVSKRAGTSLLRALRSSLRTSVFAHPGGWSQCTSMRANVYKGLNTTCQHAILETWLWSGCNIAVCWRVSPWIERPETCDACNGHTEMVLA